MLLRFHSLSRWFYLHHMPLPARVVKAAMYLIFNCILPPEVSVGPRTCFHHHGWCTLVHESVEFGSDCNIYNQVVIGGGHDGPDGPPIRIVIGDHVNISAGAKVLCKSGTLTIGSGSTIAANAVVLSDVPPNCVAVGMPARCIPKKRPVAAYETVLPSPIAVSAE
jgi:serine O-acetyltransferase